MNWRRLGPLYDLMVALQFLTRLPMPRDLNPEGDALGKAASYFPVVGLIVGGALGGLAWALDGAPWPPVVHVAFVLALGVWITGAFHEDGLADTFDGLWGGWRREDVLRIMRDSRIGTYGACALLALFVFRGAALLGMERAFWPAALALAHTVGRASSLPLLIGLPYARAEENPGVAKPLVEGLTWARLALGLLFAVGIAWALVGPFGLHVLLGAGVLTALCARYLLRRLQGMTGDTLGAVNVLCEVAALLAMSWAHPA